MATGAANSPAMSHNQDGLESGLEAVLVSEDICCVLVSLLCNHPPRTQYYRYGGIIQCHEEIDWTMDRHYRECPKDGCPCCLARFARGHLYIDEACSLCLTAWHLSKVSMAFRDAVLAHGLQQPRSLKAIRHKGAKRHMVWAARRDAARQRSDESGQSWSSSSWQRPNQGYQPQNEPPVLSVVQLSTASAPAVSARRL